MDEVVKKVAALGFPGLVLVVVMAATGLTGAAAITTALAILGGPAGMLGGIAVLGLTGLITDELAKVGLENFLTAVYCNRRQREPQGKLLEELNNLMILDGDVKDQLRLTITEGCGCSAEADVTIPEVSRRAIALLNQVPGITPTHHRDFKVSQPVGRLGDGATIRTWKNAVGVDHVFLGNAQDRIIYGGYVGWIHSQNLHQTIEQIKQELT
jgi:hypothetical protein